MTHPELNVCKKVADESTKDDLEHHVNDAAVWRPLDTAVPFYDPNPVRI